MEGESGWAETGTGIAGAREEAAGEGELEAFEAEPGSIGIPQGSDNDDSMLRDAEMEGPG